jgi:hypothetical protein
MNRGVGVVLCKTKIYGGGESCAHTSKGITFQRELNRRLIYECLCDETLKGKR